MCGVYMYKVDKDNVFDHFRAPCTCIPLNLVNSLSLFLSLSISLILIYNHSLCYNIIKYYIIYIRIFCTTIF